FILSVTFIWDNVFIASGIKFQKLPGFSNLPNLKIVNIPEKRNPFVLVLLTTIGGLLTGLVVSKFLRKEEYSAESSVTIHAYHNLGARLRDRIPFFRLVAASLTLGFGGSAGREGPMTQIGAGIASIISRLFSLKEKERRIAYIAGVAAGVGGIFKAPLGGALFAVAFLYHHDYEVEGLVPGIIAAIVSYCVVCSVFGPGPLFETQAFGSPTLEELPFYAILGLICGILGIIYVKFISIIKNFFVKLEKFVPYYLIPAIGGFLLGVIAIPFPQVLGGGYELLQDIINDEFAMEMLLILIFAKMLATAITIGSGGNGGLFAPSLAIGALIGGITGKFLKLLAPEIIKSSGAFTIVGMAGFFAGIANVPVATMIMIAEMTNSYSLVVPLMLVEAIAYSITMNYSLYETQLPSRAESPAHIHELRIPILEKIKVGNIMTKDIITLSPSDPALKVMEMIEKHKHLGYPVTENGKLVGIVTITDVENIPDEDIEKLKVKDVMSKDIVVTYPDETLYDCLHKLVKHDISRLPVVKREEREKLLGLITKTDILIAYAREEDKLRRYKRG
ncbi:MAG: chloride channel protein, partial [Candidatus Altiarchaeales archaeon]